MVRLPASFARRSESWVKAAVGLERAAAVGVVEKAVVVARAVACLVVGPVLQGIAREETEGMHPRRSRLRRER